MRKGIIWGAFAAALVLLAACGRSGADRVDVTWEVNPPPRWALFPGVRQEIPCPPGAKYSVDVFRKDKIFTGGVVDATAGGLSFAPYPGARGIAAESPERNVLMLTVTPPSEDGRASAPQRLMRIEAGEGKIYFEFFKP